MPELPEVETVRTALSQAMLGRVIDQVTLSAKATAMRWPIPADLPQRITGGQIVRVWRRGKYILLDIAKAEAGTALVMLVHLGMSGSVRLYTVSPNLRRHDHLRIRCKNNDNGGQLQLVLNDPRRFGGVQLIELAGGGAGDQTRDAAKYAAVYAHPLLRHLGVEPLGRGFTPAWLCANLKTRTAAIKTILLDQRIIAGIGNIYASEALFLAGIPPHWQGKQVTPSQAQKLITAIKKVLRGAIKAGGTSLRDHVQPSGDIGYFALKLHVYGRDGQPCHRCGRAIVMQRLGGRASYYCHHCQKGS